MTKSTESFLVCLFDCFSFFVFEEFLCVTSLAVLGLPALVEQSLRGRTKIGKIGKHRKAGKRCKARS